MTAFLIALFASGLLFAQGTSAPGNIGVTNGSSTTYATIGLLFAQGTLVFKAGPVPVEAIAFFTSANSVTIGESGGPVEEPLKDSEKVDVLHLLSVLQLHLQSARTAEVAIETKYGEAKHWNKQFDEAKKMADEAVARMRGVTADICTAHKLKSCIVEIPLKSAKDMRLKGAKP